MSAASHADDLLALANETIRVVRRGSGAAAVAMTVMITVSITLVLVLSTVPWIARLVHSPITNALLALFEFVVGVAFYALVPASLQAGPLAAYGLVALGDTPAVRKTLRVAFRALPRLAVLYLPFVLVPLSCIGVPATLLFQRPGSSDVVPVVLVLAACTAFVIWAHARLLLFAEISFALPSAAPWRERPSSWQLGRGRFPLQLVATIVPYFALVAARPSSAAEDFLSGEIARTLPVVVAIAGLLIFVFLRPALAAAAYSVALGPPPEKAAT
jgi:hypothetical protein